MILVHLTLLVIHSHASVTILHSSILVLIQKIDLDRLTLLHHLPVLDLRLECASDQLLLLLEHLTFLHLLNPSLLPQQSIDIETLVKHIFFQLFEPLLLRDLSTLRCSC